MVAPAQRYAFQERIAAMGKKIPIRPRCFYSTQNFPHGFSFPLTLSRCLSQRPGNEPSIIQPSSHNAYISLFYASLPSERFTQCGSTLGVFSEEKNPAHWPVQTMNRKQAPHPIFQNVLDAQFIPGKPRWMNMYVTRLIHHQYLLILIEYRYVHSCFSLTSFEHLSKGVPSSSEMLCQEGGF